MTGLRPSISSAPTEASDGARRDTTEPEAIHPLGVRGRNRLPGIRDDLEKPASLSDPTPSPSTGRPPDSIEVVLVTAPHCHFCEDAKTGLADLARRYPLRIRHVDLAEPEGAVLVRRFRVPFPPIVMIDGTFFGHGRISLRKLEAALTARTSEGR